MNKVIWHKIPTQYVGGSTYIAVNRNNLMIVSRPWDKVAKYVLMQNGNALLCNNSLEVLKEYANKHCA